jgi:tRNA threonylcarbamoyladenosine biosynthesis protein TsaE
MENTAGMQNTGKRRIHWQSEDDTAAFALRLSALPALRNACITLDGDLGTGKTTFVRHLLRTLGVTGRIKSPTYAVVEPYELDGWNAWHFDLYRFSDPQEWTDAGLDDLLASPGLKLIEWPQKAAGTLPAPDLIIHLKTGDNEVREIELEALSPAGEKLLCAADAPAVQLGDAA